MKKITTIGMHFFRFHIERNRNNRYGGTAFRRAAHDVWANRTLPDLYDSYNNQGTAPGLLSRKALQLVAALPEGTTACASQEVQEQVPGCRPDDLWLWSLQLAERDSNSELCVQSSPNQFHESLALRCGPERGQNPVSDSEFSSIRAGF